jgi:hypothetical protein
VEKVARGGKNWKKLASTDALSQVVLILGNKNWIELTKISSN